MSRRNRYIYNGCALYFMYFQGT